MMQSAAALPIAHDGQSPMGRILLEAGKITEIDIERILRTQEKDGIRFGDAAKALGLVSEADITSVLAKQFGYHYLLPGQGKYPPELVAAYDPFGKQGEILRAVRTQLVQRWFSKRTALVVSSVMEGEGASLFIANLGVVFSQLGQRTLVIDANLRRPRQHEIFALKCRQGLSDILANRAGVETFSKVDPFHLLSVLPAGTRPPNPQELISRPSFGELCRSLANRYDVVLIDVPAFSNGADALAITRTVDGVLFLCRRNKTPLPALQEAAAQVSMAGAQVVGSVMTDF